MAEVVWSPRAVDDVRVIATYIAEDSLAYAKSVAQKIVASTRRLSTFPMSGRVVPEFGDEHIREVFAYSYVEDGEGVMPARRQLTTACTRPPTRCLSSTFRGSGRRVMPGVRRLCCGIFVAGIRRKRLLSEGHGCQ
jgi:plasmid stabilization system protein ParE